MIVNNELPSLWKNVVMKYIKVLLCSLAGENVRTGECLAHYNWANIQDHFACRVFTAISVLLISSINKTEGKLFITVVTGEQIIFFRIIGFLDFVLNLEF
jgi:hypothetical protein